MNYCPLGLECLFDESVSVYEHYHCKNTETCYTWTTAWELPYWWNYEGLTVDFIVSYNNLQNHISDNPITSRYDWSKYFAEYGFAEAVNLPYFFRASNNTMMIFIDKNNVCREEIRKAGYANAINLPLQNRKEYSSPDTYEGLSYLEVDLTQYDDDDALNALNAGYANAIELTPLSLGEQRREYFDEYEDELNIF